MSDKPQTWADRIRTKLYDQMSPKDKIQHHYDRQYPAYLERALKHVEALTPTTRQLIRNKVDGTPGFVFNLQGFGDFHVVVLLGTSTDTPCRYWVNPINASTQRKPLKDDLSDFETTVEYFCGIPFPPEPAASE